MGNYFGKFNQIYFHRENGLISAVSDRARRTEPVSFQEVLIEHERPFDDRAEDSKLTLESHSLDHLMHSGNGGWESALRKTVTRAGLEFEVIGQSQEVISVGGGRNLFYDTLTCDTEKTTVLLTVRVPPRSTYSVLCEPQSNSGDLLQLADRLTVRLFSNGNLKRTEGVLFLQTDNADAEIGFLFESTGLPIPVSSTVLVAVSGHERQAVLARAACGREFVPCFEVPHSALWREVLQTTPGAKRAIILGSDETQVSKEEEAIFFPNDLNSSTAFTEASGIAPHSKTVVAEDDKSLYGPALYIALSSQANLEFRVDHQGLALYENGANLRSWSRSDFEGVVLSESSAKAERQSPNSELVLCENTLRNLLVCQGVGYAIALGQPLAFLPATELDEEPSQEESFETVRAKAESMVPLALRRPGISTLTVFTDHTPLHLVRTRSDAKWPSGYWGTDFQVTHLPGSTASMLIPRFFQTLIAPASGLGLAIAFNALGEAGDESSAIVGSFRSELSSVIILDGAAATSGVLANALSSFPSELLVLSAHGQPNGIRGSDGKLIEDSTVEQWTLNGRPLVFNNSCTSLFGSGSSFLKAGARGFIGTLWEVRNETAAAVGLSFSKELGTRDAAGALAVAIRDSASGLSHPEDSGTYVYIGLPGVEVRARRPVDAIEKLSSAALAYFQLYETLNVMVSSGHADAARLLNRPVRAAVKDGFAGLIVPGEMPLRLPAPFTSGVLDLDYLLASSDFHLQHAITKTLPPEQQVTMALQAFDALNRAISELSSRENRYIDHYLVGRDLEEARKLASGDHSEITMFSLLAKTACDACLPLATSLADLHLAKQAWEMLHVASIMVTIRVDLVDGTPPTPDVVRNRIRAGVPHHVHIYRPEGDANEPMEFDLLSHAVNRSDLANRFGIAYRHLNDTVEAVAFYQLALELAEPGSSQYQNAISNLGTVLRDRDSLLQAFAAQEQSGDVANWLTTGANLLRAAALDRVALPEGIVERLNSAINLLPAAEEQFYALCDLKGAHSVYCACMDKHVEALACVHEIGGLLARAAAYRTLGLGGAVIHLRELFQWYQEHDHYSNVFNAGSVTAKYLALANLEDEEVRVRIAMASSAGSAYNRTNNQKYLNILLEQSAAIGRTIRQSPEVDADLTVWSDNIRDNTFRIWEDAQHRGPLPLALLAYEAQGSWSSGESLTAWEWLRAAYSPSNLEALKKLAGAGNLKRSIRVSIDDELRETAYISSELSGCSERDTVFCTWPTTVCPKLGLDDRIVWACGVAVLKLRAGEKLELNELSPGHLYGDGKIDYVYAESWGSGLFDYDLVFELPLRFLPLHLEVTRSNVPLSSGIRFDSDRCLIHISPADRRPTETIPWSANVRMHFRDIGAAGVEFAKAGSPFLEWTPFSLWESLFVKARSQSDTN